MKAKCINTEGSTRQLPLTLGKVYDVVINDGDKNWYKLIDDDGDMWNYQSKRFEVVDEEKENKMNLKDKVFQNHNEVELRNGDKHIVVGEYLVYIYNANCKHNMRRWNDDLKDINLANEYDIVKVTNVLTSEVVFDRERDMVDWSNVEVDSKIYVKDNGDTEWAPRHFAKYDGKVYSWYNGMTSFSTKTGSVVGWDCAKLYKEGK